ncbi:MAG TPA: XdhC/CoxI family protein [Clostridia bacterium]|nr:XdhC/CoxI family protein [Clostridia bacterium]
MEFELLEKLARSVKENRRAALVTLVDEKGSSPGKQGFMMVVFEDGSTAGTVGGGGFENKARECALECMNEGRNRFLELEFNDSGELHMQCGGRASIFIKVFGQKDRLVIAGGGHIALELYKAGELLGFHTVIIEDRGEYANAERFPGCDIHIGNIGESMRNYPLDRNCYVVIVTRGHECDADALRAALGRGARYIGMIGSRKKTKFVFDRLLDEGCDRTDLKAVYAPIGLSLGGDSAAEIAFSIMSEILLVKNGGQLKHMKD